MKQKILMTLALLITAVTGAWAQDHEYVDLGLPSGTLWATCNVGADSPEQYGGYFAFGEVETKSSYSLNNYKWASNPHEAGTFTKYNHVDNLTVLQPEDDAATVNWGVQWRMPTVAEVEELIANCDITSTTRNNMTGYLYTSKINGETIFFPHAGYYDDDDLKFYGAGERAYLWTASVYENLGGMMFYNWYSVDGYCTKPASAGCGMTVRPVFNKDAVPVTTDAASEQDLFTEASFKMPTSDVTVNYTLVRDMQDEANPVAFSGLPSSGNIIVKMGSDGNYQPAEALTIQLIDPLAAAEAQNIIAADGITIKVLVGAENGQGAIDYDQENPITLEAFLANMKPGYYWIKAESTDETTSPYIGTVYSSVFTAVEQYDLTVKPANDFSKNGLDAVTVGSESVTIDANTGEATKTGIAPDTEVKVKAKRGYVIDKVEVKKNMPPTLTSATTDDVGKLVATDGSLFATADEVTAAGKTAAAMVAYVSSTGHGLAIALSNEDSSPKYSNAGSTAAAHQPVVTGHAWSLPTKEDWQNMIIGCGYTGGASNNMQISGLKTKLSAVDSSLPDGFYWTGSMADATYVWQFSPDGNNGSFASPLQSDSDSELTVRAVLAF